MIDLARFAEVMAILRQFPAEAPGEVLARLGLDARMWEAAVVAWSAARDAELARGASDVTRQFGVAFGRARKRLEAERPSLDSLGRFAAATATPSPPAVPTAVAVAVAPEVAVTVAGVSPSLASTMPLGAELPLSRLPFAAGRVLPAQAFEAAVEHARARQGPAPAAASSGSTVALSSMGPAPGLGLGVGLRRAGLDVTAGLPEGVAAPPPVPPGVPDLTLLQYASLRVELHAGPAQADAILARYAVRPEARALVEAYWRARFEADPLLRMMFAKAYATYTSWLRDGARAG